MSSIVYRSGAIADAPQIARYIRIAGGEMLDYLLQDFVETEAIALLTHTVQQTDSEFSYHTTEVAVKGTEIVGVACCCAAEHHQLKPEDEQLFGHRLNEIREFFEHRIDHSLYLSALAVDEYQRGQGIGRQLIERVKQRGAIAHFSSVSLMVDMSNETAIRLYQREGFEGVREISLATRSNLKEQVLLMNCPLK